MDNSLKIDKKVIRSVWLRTNLFQASWNFERMQALGYCYCMVPAIRKLYKKGSDEEKAAYKRHLEFFNTHPYVARPILGVNLAMEEQRANGAPIDDATINGVKVGMMGPLAGVGDPVFWATLRPVLAGLGAGISATSGSILGPLLFFVAWNAIRLGFSYWTISYGYRKGTDIIQDMSGGLLHKLTMGASIVGLFVMGALVNLWTNINVKWVAYKTIATETTEASTKTVQNILDDIMPGILALLLTFGVMKLLEKKVSPVMIIFGIFGIGILGSVLGILG